MLLKRDILNSETHNPEFLLEILQGIHLHCFFLKIFFYTLNVKFEPVYALRRDYGAGPK